MHTRDMERRGGATTAVACLAAAVCIAGLLAVGRADGVPGNGTTAPGGTPVFGSPPPADPHTYNTTVSHHAMVCNATATMHARQLVPCASVFSEEAEALAAAEAGLVHGALCNISAGLTLEMCAGTETHACLVGHVRLASNGSVVARLLLPHTLSSALARPAGDVNCSDVTVPVPIPAAPQWWRPEA